MRRLPALFAVVTAAVGLLVFGAGTAAAGPQAGGCHAFGEFMSTAAPSASRDQHPLGQTIRQLTPFNDALQVYKDMFCG
jgi:delta 1-pyrroline-5-carboxylate dehydrogenase